MSTEVGLQRLCLNGTWLYTRSGISELCMTTVQRPVAVIPRGNCADANIRQAERIAQTRFIQHLSSQFGRPFALDVAPEVQWEYRLNLVGTGTGRVDVMNYQPGAGDPAQNAVEVWEVKTQANGGVGSATPQVAGYVAAMKQRYGWSSAAPGTSQIGYVDYFEVSGYLRCKDGTTRNGKYEVTVPAAGVVLVTELPAEPCRTDEKENTEGEVEVEVEVPEPVGVEAPEPAPGATADPDSVSTPGIVDHVPDIRVPLTVVGVETVRQLLLKNSSEICVRLASVGPRTQRSSVSDAGLACLGAEAAMQKQLSALGAGATKSQMELAAANAMLPILLMLVADGVISEQDLADALGVDLLTAKELVATSRARASGDPHIISLDGLNYDLQAVGEFELVSVPAAEVRIQARFTRATDNLSVVNSLAMEVAQNSIELGPTGDVLLNGAKIDLPDQTALMFHEGGFIARDAADVVVQWPETPGVGAVGLTWQPNAGVGFVGFAVPPAYSDQVTGLLGDFDGDPLDDLKLRDGTQLRHDTSAEFIHDAYADSWRISDSESLFSYPEGKGTSSFTDMSFPRSLVTRGDFSAEQRAAAMQVCQTLGVAAGPGFDDCELDVLATGNWAFASAAAQIKVPSIAAGDALMSPDGRIFQGFDDEIPNNFSATRVASWDGADSFAGVGHESHPTHLSAGPHQPRLVREDHRLHPVPHAELRQDPREVRLHRRLGQEQLRRDLAVRPPLGHVPQHLQLARRERGQPRVQPVRGGGLSRGQGPGEQLEHPPRHPR